MDTYLSTNLGKDNLLLISSVRLAQDQVQTSYDHLLTGYSLNSLVRRHVRLMHYMPLATDSL